MQYVVSYIHYLISHHVKDMTACNVFTILILIMLITPWPVTCQISTCILSSLPLDSLQAIVSMTSGLQYRPISSGIPFLSYNSYFSSCQQHTACKYPISACMLSSLPLNRALVYTNVTAFPNMADVYRQTLLSEKK